MEGLRVDRPRSYLAAQNTKYLLAVFDFTYYSSKTYYYHHVQ